MAYRLAVTDLPKGEATGSTLMPLHHRKEKHSYTADDCDPCRALKCNISPAQRSHRVVGVRAYEGESCWRGLFRTNLSSHDVLPMEADRAEALDQRASSPPPR